MGILGNVYSSCSPTCSTENNVWYSKAKHLTGSRFCPVYHKLLFMVYINDFTNHVDSCETSLYADDSQLFRDIYVGDRLSVGAEGSGQCVPLV